MSISFFNDLGDLFLYFGQLSFLGSLGVSSEVECNPKMSILLFDDWVEGGAGLDHLTPITVI